jgi:4-amino-4-deoxy-L-arabinose transferase-like glycosyltransferase
MRKVTLFFKDMRKNERFLLRILFASVLIVYFIFGLYHLGKFISADEHFWLPNSGVERIQDYWKAMSKEDWKATRINDKPGITLAWTSGVAMLFDHNLKNQLISNGSTVKIFNPARTSQIDFEFRLPILLLSGLFSFFFFWIIKKITDSDWIALFSVAGIYLSPILIGMSQIVNPDSLFWVFGSASMLSFFAFLQKEERRFGILTAILLGLALASKYVSVIFFPFFFAMMLGYYLFTWEDIKKEEERLAKMVIRYGWWYLGILAVGMLIFALMMPASFVEPKVFYAGTIGFPGMAKIFWAVFSLNLLMMADAKFFASKYSGYILEKCQPLKKYLPMLVYAILSLTMVFVLVNWITRFSLLDLSNVPFDAKQKDSFKALSFYRKYIMEFVALTFSLTPVAIFSLLFAWIGSIFRKSRHDLLVFILSVFFLVFYLAVITQGLLVTTRYSIILFPFAAILAAIGLEDFFSQEKNKKNMRASTTFAAVFLGIFLLQLFSLFEQHTTHLHLRNMVDKYGSNLWISIPLVIAMVVVLTLIARRYFPWKALKKITSWQIFASYATLNMLSILLISPFYFSYTNDFLPKKYIISGAWGYGGYEAAQYLNSLPNSKNLTVWADVYGVCEFFQGKCIHKQIVDTAKYPIDYYFQSLQSTIGMNFSHPMLRGDVWKMQIDGRPKSFLKIRKANPAALTQPSVTSDTSDDSDN